MDRPSATTFPASLRAALHVGVAGWSYPDWAGIVHPATLRSGPPLLDAVARLVDAIEVNVTFYRPVPVEVVARWAEVVARHPRLIVVVKAPRDVSHEGAGVTPRDLAPFVASLTPLAAIGRLAGVLVQLPAHARATRQQVDRLRHLVDALAPHAVALELRHASHAEPDVLEALAATGASRVHLDWPASPDHLPDDTPGFGTWGYLRLHGRNDRTWFTPGIGRDARYDHHYDASSLDALATRIRAIAASSERTVVIANNHPRGQAIAASLQLAFRTDGRKRPVPASLVRHYPELAAITLPTGQLDLFA
ncbi:MAG: DUF72 domain-containing protein [Planctomycetota bacterium]